MPDDVKALVSNTLGTHINNLHYDEEESENNVEVPYSLYLPLLELGYNSFANLVSGTRNPMIISTVELVNRHGNAVKSRHKLALNKLTVLVNNDKMDRDALSKAKKCTCTGPRQPADRKVNNPGFTELCTYAPNRLDTVINTAERSAMQQLRPNEAHVPKPNYAHIPPSLESDAQINIEGQPQIKSRAMVRLNDISWQKLFSKYTAACIRRREQRATGKKAIIRKQRGARCTPPNDLLTIDAYREWMTKHSDDNAIIPPLYDQFDQAQAVVGRQWKGKQLQYLVQWKPTPCRTRHIKLHEQRGLKAVASTPYSNEMTETSQEDWSLVSWEAKWELAAAFCHPDHTDQVQMARNFDKTHEDMQPIDHTKSYEPQDSHKSNMDKQGHWIPLALKPQRPMQQDPYLKEYIDIDPNNTINPDQDIRATGCYRLGLRETGPTEEGPLVNVYNDEGKQTGIITEKRLKILYTAYKNTEATAPDVISRLNAGCFKIEVAKLMMRYKDGYNMHKDKHWQTTNLKHHLTTPDAYIDALKAGLNVDCERFASPLDFNPSLKHYYSMYDQDRVFGANINAYSTKWEAVSYTHLTLPTKA